MNEQERKRREIGTGEIQDPHLEDIFRYDRSQMYRRARREEVLRFGNGTYLGVRVGVEG